jgi:hypothetical protein
VRNRDVALIAFNLVALWIIASGLIQALELALNWHVLESKFAEMNLAEGSPSPASLTWNALGALFARSGLGVVMWLLSGLMARSLFPADDPPYSMEGTIVLYRAAAFLVGLWLLADSLPKAAFALAWAARSGWRLQDPDGVAQFASLWVKLGLGLALLRGGDWVRDLVLSKRAPANQHTTQGKSGGVEQGDEADEAR